MIYGLTHPGSGLGNQLHRYIATRVLALDKGYDFSMIGRENFKGSSFMNLEMGKSNDIKCIVEQPAGKVVPQLDSFYNNFVNLPREVWEEKTNYYNPEFNFIEDNTIIDGEFQDERYFGHRMKEIDEWIGVKPYEDMFDFECVIGFRGGEFALFPDLFLTSEYWKKAIQMMLDINPKMIFRVETDDPETAAKVLLPIFNEVYSGVTVPFTHDIESNWKWVRSAKYAIIANSSFYILPRLLRHHNGCSNTYHFHSSVTIAPRYWARRNTKEWSMPQNYYPQFKYI